MSQSIEQHAGQGQQSDGEVNVLAGYDASMPATDDEQMLFTGAPFIEEAERQRLKAVLACGPTNPGFFDRHFSEVCELVRQVLDLPIASMSFVGSDAVITRGMAGAPLPEPFDRRWSLCTWTLLPLTPEALILEDLTQDARFKEHIFVANPPHIKTYLAAPLVTSTGFRLGTVCGMGMQPRKYSSEIVKWLCNVAELVVQHIEGLLTEPLPGPQLFRTLRTQPRLVLALDMKQTGWKILYGSQKWPQHSSAAGEAAGDATEEKCALTGETFWDHYVLMTQDPRQNRPVWHQYKSFIRKQQAFQLVVRSKHNPSQLLCLDFRSGCTAKVFQDAVNITISNHEPTTDPDPVARGLYFAVLLNSDLAPAPRSHNSAHASSNPCSKVQSSSGAVEHNARQELGSDSLSAPSTELQQDSLQRDSLSELQSDSLATDSTDEFEALWQPTPFPDVQMGPMIGQIINNQSNSGNSSSSAATTGGDAAESGASTEGAVGENLHHPNIIRTLKWTMQRQLEAAAPASKRRRTDTITFGCGDAAPSQEAWLVLEYCNRGTLQCAIDRGLFRSGQSCWSGGANMAAILTLALDIAQGMAYLHKQNVIHGDLGPKNVLLVHEASREHMPFIAKVADFGLSQKHQHDAEYVMTSSYGTVTHMPSELIQDGRLTRAADVYSFGVILWELYTGQRPFAGFNPVQLLAQRILGKLHLSFEAPVPQPYKALAERCFAEVPSSRPVFADIVLALQDLMEKLQRGELEAAHEFPVWPNTIATQHAVSQDLVQHGLSLYLQPAA